jgi:AcrR family transcriptional regulator
VPKTRQSLSKDEKMDRILAAADRRLARGGFDALSVAAIARELRLAQNTLYWYFPSKDHLFVAVLQRMLGDIAARKPSRGQDAVERILWFTDQFAALSQLRAAMNERSAHSELVAEFVAELDRTLERMLSNALAGKVAPEELPMAVETFRATAEGTFVKGLSRRKRRRLLRFTLEHLTR